MRLTKEFDCSIHFDKNNILTPNDLELILKRTLNLVTETILELSKTHSIISFSIDSLGKLTVECYPK